MYVLIQVLIFVLLFGSMVGIGIWIGIAITIRDDYLSRERCDACRQKQNVRRNQMLIKLLDTHK